MSNCRSPSKFTTPNCRLQSDTVTKMTSSTLPFASPLLSSVVDPSDETSCAPDRYLDKYRQLQIHEMMRVDFISMSFNTHEHLSTPLRHLSHASCRYKAHVPPYATIIANVFDDAIITPHLIGSFHAIISSFVFLIDFHDDPA